MTHKMIFRMFLTLNLFLMTTFCIATEPPKKNITPSAAVNQLKRGNLRFAKGVSVHPHVSRARLAETAKNGQFPIATILTCSDSRVSPEILFDQGIGDLFVIRLAGNTAGGDDLGTMEYGVEVLHTPLIVVLGHTKCGAVTATVDESEEATGHIKEILTRIAPAVEQAKAKVTGEDREKLIEASVEENVWLAMENVLKNSDTVKNLVAEKKVEVIGAIYDIKTGRVRWLGENPKQDELLK